MVFGFKSVRILFAGLAVAVVAQTATLSQGQAQERTLTVAMAEATRSNDPHWSPSVASFHINSQIFEQLYRWDDEGVPRPLLATKMVPEGERTWYIHLRTDVKWSDGSPFTAEDVVFSIDRANANTASPSTFKTYLRQIEKAEVHDAHTVKITTNEPAPLLPESLTYFLIASKKHAQNATVEDFNNGKAMIGTGPYKFVSWTPNSISTLAKNENYWGEQKPVWDKIHYRFMGDASSRVAALLAGDVDIIYQVPSQDMDRLAANKNIKIWRKLSNRVSYFTVDVEKSAESTMISDMNGQKLSGNPFADPRVRLAMSLAIDREAIVKRLYNGEAEPAGQYLLPSADGYNPELKPAKPDVNRAIALMKEAGYPRIKLELAATANFFPKSVEISEVVAQMWTRIGIQTSVTTRPVATYLKARADREFPISLSAASNLSGSSRGYFPTFMHTRDLEKGHGTLNYARYSNPKVDQLIDDGMTEFDEQKRNAMFREISKISVGDHIMVPLVFFYNVAASKANLEVNMRTDSGLYGSNVKPAK